MTAPSSRSISRRRQLGFGLLAFALTLLILLVAGFFGWRNGQLSRLRQAEESRDAELAQQVELAATDSAEGRYAMAISRLDFVLDNETSADAASLRVTVQALYDATRAVTPTPTLTATPTPTASPSPTPTPTNTPTPSPTPVDLSDEARELGRQLETLRALIVQAQWDTAIREIIAFQIANPLYERTETDRLLFEAHLNYGMLLAETEQLEASIRHLDSASELGELPVAAIDMRSFAATMVNARAFWEIDWRIVVSNLENLCLVNPLFQDSCGLLYEARIEYAEDIFALGEACIAFEQYEEALKYRESNEIRLLRNDVQRACAQATFTPTPAVTPTPTPQSG